MPPLLRVAFLAAVAVTHAIPPPENITVQCHNLKNIVYWNYSRPTLSPQFVVYVHGYMSGSILVETCNHTRDYFCNISAATHDMGDQYYVNVTALVGTSLSQPTDSAAFSYSSFFSEDCKLDFPPATLGTDEEGIKIEFLHPLDQYREDLQNIRNKEDYNIFTFRIFYENKDTTFECYADAEEFCMGKIKISKNRTSCFDLHGRMNGINISPYSKCMDVAELLTNKPYQFYVLVGVCIAVICSIFLFFGTLGYRNLTSANTSFPKTMASIFTQQSKAVGTINPDKETTSAVQPLSPLSTDQLIPSDFDLAPACTGTSNSDCPRFQIGRLLADTKEYSGSVGAEGMSETDSSGPSMSGYDRPKLPIDQCSQVEMSPGDTVDGYRD